MTAEDRATAMVRARIAAMMAEAGHDMAAMRERKPTVIDGHSDGVRVRYCRRESTIAALQAVLDMLDGAA